MRLRALRKLEEIEIRKEREDLLAEQAELTALVGDEALQWKAISSQLSDVAKAFGANAEGGARRTTFETARDMPEVTMEAMIEREPITVLCSEMGWIRAMKGHVALDGEYKFKDGDGPRLIFHAETTDKLVLVGSNGRFYTLGANDLPGGRGMGEPVRLMVDFPQEARIVDLFVHNAARRLIVASTGGNGFVVDEADVIAQTRNGKQVMNLGSGEALASVHATAGDHIAVVGDNRKLLVFPLDELPQLSRGKGVRLQKYKDGGLSDLRTFTLTDGLSWLDPAGRTRTVTDLEEWLAKRATSGRMAPRGFPRDNKF